MNSDVNYCWTCGERLRRELVDHSFNLLDGKKEYNIIWVCRHWRWWHLGFRHVRIKSDMNGNTYMFQN